ncbi:MAG: hypothetical protein ACRDFQ_05270 [Anaerolineales bacterium]
MSEKTYRIFLGALAFSGSLLVYLATSAYGPGLSTDGARYLSTAENIARGAGAIDYLDVPLINWPPLYPLILAGLHLLTGEDVFILGQIVNILAFGAIIWLGGIFFARSLPESQTLAPLAALFLAAFLPLIEVSAGISSDPLFMILVFCFLLTAQNYLRAPQRKYFWLLAFIAVAATFTRYAGFALVFSGSFFIAWAHRKDTRKAMRRGALFAFSAAAPIGAWAVLHNYRLTGYILGQHRPANAAGNFVSAVTKIAGWFLPETILGMLPPLLLLLLLLFAIALRSNRERWRQWLKKITAPNVLPSAIFAAAYGAMLIFTISYGEHRVPGSQRIHAILMPAFLVCAVVSAQTFLGASKQKRRNTLRNLGLALFAIWFIFPAYRVQVYVSASMKNGDVSFYNIYTTRTIRESDIVAQLNSLEFPQDERIYSNNEAAAWFYLRRRIYRLPTIDREQGESIESAIAGFRGWPEDGEQATLIWFERDLEYKEFFPAPEELEAFFRLKTTFVGRYGNIYLMDF